MGKPVAAQNATLPGNQSALPESWVSKIFEKFEDRMGDQWASRYGAVPRARMVKTWAEDLADLTREELARGVAACRDLTFPPSMGEFRALCRPPIDYQAAYIEAVEQMRKRDSGCDQWSNPAIFWAAAKIGHDLRTMPYTAIKTRWAVELDNAINDVRNEDLPTTIPKPVIALPAPGETTPDRAKVEMMLKRVRAVMKHVEC